MYRFIFTYYKLIGYLPNCQFCVENTDSIKHKNVPNSRDEPVLSIIPIKNSQVAFVQRKSLKDLQQE